jgi:hypothetical protein
MSTFANFLIGFGFNLLVALLVVRFIYYPSTHNKAYVFTFLAFNTIIYFVLSFLATIEIGLGVGFGLFAIFSILRYRTDPIPIREMTYLFLISALPVMNSAANSDNNIWPQLLAANLAVLALLWVLEKGWGFRYETSRQVIYEKIELIAPERRAELQADLEQRTGLKIKRILLGKLDFLRDTVNLKIFYDDPTRDGWLNGSCVDE